MNEDDLPCPRPPLKHPPLMDLSFAALGWLHRTAAAAGHPRFPELVQRTRFYLEKVDAHAGTPAEKVVIAAMTAALDGLVRADADAREILGASLAAMDSAELEELGRVPETPDEG